MKIEVGIKCKQTKAIEKYGFDYVGMEFEITKVNDKVIMCMGNGIGFGIDPSEFENYFEVIKEEIKEKENNIMNINTNHKGKKIRIINTEGFIRDNYKDLDKYIGQTGVVRCDFEGSSHRLSIKFDDEVLDSINDDNGRLCFRIDNVEFVSDNCKKYIEKNNKTLNINEIKIGQKYRVIKNRDTYYGNCTDIVDIEGQEVEVYGLNVNNEGDVDIKSKDGTKHTCQAKNLEIIKKEKEHEKQVVEQEKQKPTNKVYTYNMIPHKINWKITYDGEIIHQTIDSGNESYKLIINGNTTIVILDDGCKGVAKCMEGDEYDKDKGIDIAYTKAIIKSNQKKLKGLVK